MSLPEPPRGTLFLYAAVSGVGAWLVWRRCSQETCRETGSVSLGDLLDPEHREHHLRWNLALQSLGTAVIPVAGARSTFVVVGHDAVSQLSQDPRLTSNPYEDDRLIALNTMEKHRHGVVAKLLHRFYHKREMRRLEPDFLATMTHFGATAVDAGTFDVMPWARRVHMANTLKVLMGPAAAAAHLGLIDRLIQCNDDMIRLVAPLGGVGRPCPALFSWSSVHFLLGAVSALPAMFKFLWRSGLTGVQIMRPDKTLSRSALGSGVWHSPELLPQVPRYFSLLLDLWDATTPNSALVPQSPLEALRMAVDAGDVSLAEALVTIVQLMVNMTSANALGNLIHRLCTEARPTLDDADLDQYVAEVLRLDAPLQRNPRRALEAVDVGGTVIPKGASVLLFIGAANLDSSIYKDAASFRPGRTEQTLTFGVGPHFCLGAYLVKAEMREAVRYLLSNFSHLKVQHSERVRDVDVGNYGFESLRVSVQ